MSEERAHRSSTAAMRSAMSYRCALHCLAFAMASSHILFPCSWLLAILSEIRPLFGAHDGDLEIIHLDEKRPFRSLT